MDNDNWGRSLTGKQLFCKQLIEGSIPSASIRLADRYFLTETGLLAGLFYK